MRRISRTNSHKYLDESLRREYASVWPDDQIAFELGIVLKDNLGFTHMYVGCKVDATDTNHIFTNPRWDLESNLIRLSAPAHRWFHRNLDSGRVLCLCAKARQRERYGLPKEFDIGQLTTCRKNIIGWLEAVELPPWINCFRDETLSRLSQLASVPDLSQ